MVECFLVSKYESLVLVKKILEALLDTLKWGGDMAQMGLLQFFTLLLIQKVL